MDKTIFSKFLLLIAVMVTGAVSVWAEETYEIVFLTGSSDNNNAMQSTATVSDIIGDGANYVSGFGTSTAKAYPKSKNGIKLGTSSASGTIELKLASNYQANIKTIKVISAQYGEDTGSLSLFSGTTSLKTGITPGEDYTHTFDTPATVSSIKLSTSSKRAYISRIILTTQIVLNYTLSAISSNDNFGTVYVHENMITASPAEGYRVSTSNPYQVTSGTANVTQNGNVFTVEAENDCTIQINFEAIPKHNVTFYINGQSSTTSFNEGAIISFPETPLSIWGNDFIGWSSSSIQGTMGSAPELVSEAIMESLDMTFFAVFAAPTYSTVETTKSYGFETSSDDYWIIDGPVRNNTMHNTGSYSGRINTNRTYITFKNKVRVTEFAFAFARTSTNENYYVHIETSTDNSTWAPVENYPMSIFANGSFTTKSHTFDGKSELYVRFHCYNTTAVRYVDDVTIKYKEVKKAYTNYCTTVPTSATFSIASACTDGSLYYGTYSNTQPFVVPSDLDVYEMTIANGVISKEKYETGTVVPANTGVLVAAQAAGNYTVNFSSDQGTSVLGASNMLRASGNGIDVDAMEMADVNSKYYRLTMHNGTQIGFYWGAENGAAFNVAANKAYLAVPEGTSQGARGFNLYGGPTGIKEVFDSTDQFSSYNLQGQRVAANKKGLVIKNGKKYFNK